MAEGSFQPEATSKLDKGAQTFEALRGMGSSIAEASRAKKENYVDRILAGEKPEELLKGCPRTMIGEVLSKVSTIRDNVTNPDSVWASLYPQGGNNAERKTFDYACSILMGQKFDEITQGLSETWKTSIKQNINKIKTLPQIPQGKSSK